MDIDTMISSYNTALTDAASEILGKWLILPHTHDSGAVTAPLICLRDDDMAIDTVISSYNTALTDAASEILGKWCRKKP